MTVVVGTAGHIDHGKTSLLRALTGIDADRLPEERARGMTIDVGYAHLRFDDGVELDFVDVPGHDRLIGNMLVGAGEIDAAMLVVAADDGPRPQTIEHLQLLDALAIDLGLAVVTKSDAVDGGRVEEVRDAVAALLGRTALAGAPVVAASSVTGAGLDAVRRALRGVNDAVLARRGSPGPTRLAVDRVFTPKGRGIVVTGSLRGGAIATGAWLRREPGGELVRVREVQVHGESRPGSLGGRTALNLSGEAAQQVRRGDVLATGDSVRGTERLLVQLRRPADLGGTVEPGGTSGTLPRDAVAWPPKGRRGLRVHAGTAQVTASLRPVPGSDGFAALTVDEPVGSFPGDRLVVRDPASGAVVAGARVLDLAPPRGPARRRLDASRLAALAEGVARDDAPAIDAATVDLHGVVPRRPTAGPRPTFRELALAGDVRAALGAEALAVVAAHHRATPMSPGLPRPRARAALLRRLRSLATVERGHVDLARTAIDGVLDELVAAGELARAGDALRDPAQGAAMSAELLGAMDRLEALLAAPAPPPLADAAASAGCPPDGIRALQADGRIVRLADDLAWATSTYHRLAAQALEAARRAPLTPAAFRDATGTSRKYVLAILEDLDRRGVLRRTPEGHIPGPRAPRVATPAEVVP